MAACVEAYRRQLRGSCHPDSAREGCLSRGTLRRRPETHSSTLRSMNQQPSSQLVKSPPS